MTTPKARIFISYSRKDSAFAGRLDAALKSRGLEPVIDRSEIYAFEDWWKRIQALIVQADTVVFVLTPDSVSSEVCAKEVAYAASLNKRFAPVVSRPVDEKLVPEALARLNFVFFDDEAKFAESLDLLVEALATDIEWIRHHTEFGEAARQWAAGGQPNGLLLRSPLLEQAEHWIASRPANAPAPTDETRAFIAASRSGATRRRNVLTGSLAAGLIVALGLAGLAYWQQQIAVENEARAVANEQAANAQRVENLKSGSRLVAVASHQLADENRPDLAQAIALEGLPDGLGDRPLVDEAFKALTRAIRADRSLAVLTLGHEQFVSGAFTPDGKTLVTGTDSGKLVVWDTRTYRPRLQIETGSKELFKISISPDGRSILDSSDFHPSVWDLTTGELQLRLPKPEKGYAGRSRFSPDGKQIATGYSDNHAEIRDAATGTLLHRLEGVTDFDEAYGRRSQRADDDPIAKAMARSQWRMNGGTTEVLFSPDGKTLAVAGVSDPQGAARLFDVATGKLIATLPGENLVLSLSQQRMAFSPDSALLALAGTDNVVRVWGVSEGKLLFALPHTAESHALIFDPGGSFLIVAYADGSMRVWGAQDGRIVATFAAHVDGVTALAFSPTGETFATASNDRDVRVWWNTLDAQSCGPSERTMSCDTHLHPAAVLRGHADKVGRIIFSPDGAALASIANDSTIRIWRTGMVGEVPLHLTPQAQAPEESCAPDQPAPVSQEAPTRPFTEAETRQKAIEVFGPEAAYEAATEDIVVLREKLSARLKALIAEQEEAARAACEFSKVMADLSKKNQKAATVYQRFSEQMGRTVDLPNGADDAYRIAFADRDHLLVPDSDDEGFALLDLTTGQPLCHLPGDRLSMSPRQGVVMLHDGPLSATPAQCQPDATDDTISSSPAVFDSGWVMSPNGARAVGSREWLVPRKEGDNSPPDNTLILIDPDGKRAVAELKVDGRDAKSALFSADGAIVIGALAGDQDKSIGDDSQYAVWDASTGSLYGVTAPGTATLHHVAITADGRTLVLAEDGASPVNLYFIDTDGQLKSRAMAGPSRGVSAVAISPDGATVAVAYVDGTIAFFSARDGNVAATMSAGLYPIIRLAFSPDSRTLAGAGTNRTVWLWDIPSKFPIVVTSTRGDPTALKFSPTGDRLAVRTNKAEVRVLSVGVDHLGLDQPQDIIDWARASLSTALSENDRQRFLLLGAGKRATSPGMDGGAGLRRIFEAVAPADRGTTTSADASTALRKQAVHAALDEGLPGAANALTYAMKAAGGNPVDAALQLGLDIDDASSTDEARELAFFYLQLGHRFAESDPTRQTDELRGVAGARLRTLPQQIAPSKLIRLYRLAQSWRAP